MSQTSHNSNNGTSYEDEVMWCDRIAAFLSKRNPREWFLFSNICAEVPRGSFLDKTRKSFTVVKEDQKQRFTTQDGEPGRQFIKLREPNEKVISTLKPSARSMNRDSYDKLHSPIVTENEGGNIVELSHFRPGTRCRIEGTKKAELNGMIGVVASGPEAEKEKRENGRVLLTVDKSLVSLLPERLIIITDNKDKDDNEVQVPSRSVAGGSGVQSSDTTSTNTTTPLHHHTLPPPPLAPNAINLNPNVWIPMAISKIVPCIISNLSSWAGERNAQISNRGYSEEDLRKWATKPSNAKYVVVGIDNFIPPIWNALKKESRLHHSIGTDGVASFWCSSDIDGPTGPTLSSSHIPLGLPIPVDAWIVKTADACIEAALVMLADPEKPRPFEQSRVEKRVSAALKGGSLSPLPVGLTISDVTQRVCQRISNDSRLIVKPFYKLPHYFASSPEFGLTHPVYPKKGSFIDGANENAGASSFTKKMTGTSTVFKEEFLANVAQKYATFAMNAMKGLAGVDNRHIDHIRPYTIGRLRTKILEKEDVPPGITLDKFVKLIWPRMAAESRIKETITSEGELCYVLSWMPTASQRAGGSGSGTRPGGGGAGGRTGVGEGYQKTTSVQDEGSSIPDEELSPPSDDEEDGRRASIDSELQDVDDANQANSVDPGVGVADEIQPPLPSNIVNNEQEGQEEETDHLLHLAGIREIWDEETQAAAMNRPLSGPLSRSHSPTPSPPGLTLPLGQYPSSQSNIGLRNQFFDSGAFHDVTAQSLSLPKSFFFDASKNFSLIPTVDLADGDRSKHLFEFNRALLGSIEIVEQPIYLNTAEQFCCVTIGDKDCINHVLSLTLESCLIPFSDADVAVVASENSAALKSVVVFTLDHPSTVCDAAGLAIQSDNLAASLQRSGSSIKAPFIPQTQIKVLASPFFYKQRQYHYGQAYSVRPITFKWSRLSVDHIKRILRIKETVNDAANQNNQFASVIDVLRKYQKGATRPSFITFCDEIKRLSSFKHIDSQLPQRLRLLESIVFESSENVAIAAEWPNICDHIYTPGSLMIVDLTDPLLSTSDCNCVFQVFAEQFRSEQRNAHTEKLLAVHNLQNYIDPVGSGGLTDILITFAQQKVMRLFVSTTSPHSMPTALLESCTVAILHRFHSREWLRAVAKALPINDAAFERFVSLQLGQAIVFGSRCSIQDIERSPFGYNVFPIRLRPKITGNLERRALVPM